MPAKAEKPAPKAPPEPTIEVLQFNIKALYTIRDSGGKIAATQEQEITIMQTDFQASLEFVAERVIEYVKQQLANPQGVPPQGVPAPPKPPQPNRASRRRLNSAIRKG